MARQKGIIKLEGAIGDYSFYKSKDGYLAREKGGIDGKRIATDPAFERTRENGAEFGRAGSAGKLLRKAFRTLLASTSDSRMVSRLTKTMVQVIKADQVNDRGKRNVIDGEALLLKGFEFNESSSLNAVFLASFVPAIDRVTGSMTLDVPAFVPSAMVIAPTGATHFRIVFGCAEIDFEHNEFVAHSALSSDLPLDNAATGPLQLQHTLTAGSIHPLFMVMGIEFHQQVNGTLYALKTEQIMPCPLWT